MMIYFKDDKYLPNAMNVDIALKKDLSKVKYGDFVEYKDLEDNKMTSRYFANH